jgi:hypothetical protein
MNNLLFCSHLLPDYIIIQPMIRDAKEFLVIDRTHEDIQIHSKIYLYKIFYFLSCVFKILYQMLMEPNEHLFMG